MKRYAKTLVVMAALVSAGTVSAQPMDAERTPRHDKMIERLDRDGDGAIDLDEFQMPPRAWSRFDNADANDDGTLTREELTAQLAKQASEREARAMAMFRESDINGDGAVTDEERKVSAFGKLDQNEDGLVTVEELRNAHAERGRHGRDGRHER